MKLFLWITFAFFAILVGLYPFIYLFVDMRYGLLATKSAELLHDVIWSALFRTHIFMGGVALLSGWSQFSKKIKSRKLSMHRTLGKIYLVAISLSGCAALYLSFYATGGIIASLGFGSLAVAWLFTSLQAYRSILQKQITTHEKWMIRSYALCFAAVTLRIWLPMFQFGFGMDFFIAYKIIAWLCWIPNMLIAELIIYKMRQRSIKGGSLSFTT